MENVNHGGGDIQILPPNKGLKEKFGPHQSFDQVVSPRVVAAAQDVIVKSADEILAMTLTELENLQNHTSVLKVDMPGQAALVPVIEAAFAIKSNAGLCGYTFASRLAKSLYVYCELDAVLGRPLTAKSLEIIRAQVTGLKTVFTAKITGDGGTVGQTILTELQKLY